MHMNRTLRRSHNGGKLHEKSSDAAAATEEMGGSPEGSRNGENEEVLRADAIRQNKPTKRKSFEKYSKC